MKTVTVTRKVDDLTNDKWDFVFFEDRMMLVLNACYREARASKRSKKTEIVGPRYSRTFPSSIPASLRMTEGEVPFFDGVKEEALATFVAQLQVGLWMKDYGSKF